MLDVITSPEFMPGNKDSSKDRKEEVYMLFMVTTTWEPEQTKEVIKRRLEREKGNVGLAGVKVVGEWAYLGGRRAFVLCDVEDPAALMEMSMTWSDLASMEVVPVLERKEVVKLRNRLK